MTDHPDSFHASTEGSSDRRPDLSRIAPVQPQCCVLSVPCERLVLMGLLAKYNSFGDYCSAVRALMKITNEVHRLFSESEDSCLDVRTMSELKHVPRLDSTTDYRFSWLLNASFDERLQWLQKAPIEQRVEWIFDRVIDPVGAPITHTQLILFLRDIEQQAHEAYPADVERMRTALCEIWLQLEYLIPLIKPSESMENQDSLP